MNRVKTCVRSSQFGERLIPISSVHKLDMQRDTHVYMSVKFFVPHHGKIVPQPQVLDADNDRVFFN